MYKLKELITSRTEEHFLLQRSSKRNVQLRQYYKSSISHIAYFMMKSKHKANFWNWLMHVFHMNSGIHSTLLSLRTSRNWCYTQSYNKFWRISKMVTSFKDAFMKCKRLLINSMKAWKFRKLQLASWAFWSRTFLTLPKLRLVSLERISVSSTSGTQLNKLWAFQDITLMIPSNFTLPMIIYCKRIMNLINKSFNTLSKNTVQWSLLTNRESNKFYLAYSRMPSSSPKRAR